MKNIGAFLYIAFAILLQFQENVAKEHSFGDAFLSIKMEEFDVLVRRIEYSWLPFVSATIQIITFIMGYEGIEGNETHCYSNRLIDKFGFLKKFESLFDSSNMTNFANKTIQGMKDNFQRNIDWINQSLNLTIRPNISWPALSNTRVEEEDVFNVEFVDETINRSVNLFKGKQHSESSEVIEFPKTGFECTQEFCDEHGNGVHALGVCLPLFCACNERGAEGHKCPDSFIFDPVHGNCVNPKDAKICGFR